MTEYQTITDADTPLRDGTSAGGAYCREYQQTIYVGGQQQTAGGCAGRLGGGQRGQRRQQGQGGAHKVPAHPSVYYQLHSCLRFPDVRRMPI